MTYTRPKTTELELTRTIKARPEEVYSVWLDPESPGGPWFGSSRVIVDPKVDGLFYQCVTHEGRDYAHYGRFVALEPGKRIEHTWMSEGTRGLESRLTLTFARQGEHTLITLRHSGVPDDDFGRQHRDGWEFVLGKIEQAFAKR